MSDASATPAEKMAYAAYTNTDLNEGRGYEEVLVICEMKATAARIGKKKYVQGGDCPVRPIKLYKYGNSWFGPVQVEQPSDADIQIETVARNRASVLEKAKALGLSDADIAILGGAK